MTECNKRNACMGYYGNTLDVKITNGCNADCAFCIEKGGYCPPQAPARKLIAATLAQKPENVLVLGGEPLVYPHLMEYLSGVRPSLKKVFLTTNGLALTPKMAVDLSHYLNAINVSIHHWNMGVNRQILRSDKPVSTDVLRQSFDILNRAGVSTRINANLVRDGLDNYSDIDRMIQFAIKVGAKEIRFNELQSTSIKDGYIDARYIFEEIPEEPFSGGCECTIHTTPVKVIVKQVCGACSPHKPRIDAPEQATYCARVLYPNGEITNGWQKKVIEPDPMPDCHCRPSFRGHCANDESMTFRGHCGQVMTISRGHCGTSSPSFRGGCGSTIGRGHC